MSNTNLDSPDGSQVFKQAKRVYDTRAVAETILAERVLSKCLWYDPADVAAYKREERRTLRLKTLDELVPDRRCPVCTDIKIGPRQFVVDQEQKICVCRACFVRCCPKENVVVPNFLAGPETVRYSFDGILLKQARLDMGISMSEFARRCGWSAAYQNKLEGEVVGRRTFTIAETTAIAILQVLKDARATLLALPSRLRHFGAEESGSTYNSLGGEFSSNDGLNGDAERSARNLDTTDVVPPDDNVDSPVLGRSSAD